MDVIADCIVAYAQPLIKRNSSLEQIQHAMMIAQFCWNLSVMPDEKRESRLMEIQKTLEFSDTDFNEFRKEVHPTKAYLASWIDRIFNSKNSISR